MNRVTEISLWNKKPSASIQDPWNLNKQFQISFISIASQYLWLSVKSLESPNINSMQLGIAIENKSNNWIYSIGRMG